MHDLLIGKWIAIRRGLDPTKMVETQNSTREEYLFHPDGTAECRTGFPLSPDDSPSLVTWRILGGKDLLIEVGVEPMPEYGIVEPMTEEIRFRIAVVDEDRLILDSRFFGGESVTEFERRPE